MVKPQCAVLNWHPRRTRILLIGGQRSGMTRLFLYQPDAFAVNPVCRPDVLVLIHRYHPFPPVPSVLSDQLTRDRSGGGSFFGDHSPVGWVSFRLSQPPLQELRQTRHLTRVTLAKNLKVQQASISKMENRTDMYISTLRNMIKVMGGDLEILAKFLDGCIRINQLEEIEENL